MKTLFINTCLDEIKIILFHNKKIIREETIYGQRNNNQFLMPTIKKVLEDDKPDEILVINGPGSFTGIRLGITVAKTFAYILDIPIRTMTTLEIMAVSINEAKEILAVEENNGYYIGIFDEYDALIGDYKYLSKEDYIEFNAKYKIITNVTIDYKKVLEFASKKEISNPHLVKPLYVKKIEVELNIK